jgi:hypothetical protein
VVRKSTGLPVTPQVTPDSSSLVDLPDFFGADVDPTDLTFMFALRIHDDTACADAIVFGMVFHFFYFAKYFCVRKVKHFFVGCQKISSSQITESEQN